MDELANHLITCYEKGIFLPYLLELRVSHKCNLKCIYCPGYDNEVNPAKSLSTKKWLLLIQEAKMLGIQECAFFSDLEPLMHKDALKIMVEIKRQNLFGQMTTNGTLLDERMCTKLIENEWDEINVSIEGPDKETNDYIRGNGTFNKVYDNLLCLQKIKKRLHKENPKIIFNVVLTNKIYSKIDKMIIFASKLGISFINFQALSLWNNKCKNLQLTRAQDMQLVRHIHLSDKLSKQLKLRTNIHTFVNTSWTEYSIRGYSNNKKEHEKNKHELLNIDCYLPWYFISVDEDGRVNPCHTIRESKENVNNKTLKEIWSGPYFDYVRKKIQEKDFPKRCYTNCCVVQAAHHLDLRNEIKDIINKMHKFSE